MESIDKRHWSHHNFQVAFTSSLYFWNTVIPSKSDFLKVSFQMLFAQIMKNTLFCAL